MDLLKLLALDEEDLKIVSAHVQDAVMKLGDLEFVAATKQFVVPMYRFAWERDATERKPQPERRNSVMHFDRVLSAKLSGISRDKPDDVLSLLAVAYAATDAPAGTVDLLFSGGGAIRLEVECIEARLVDLGGAGRDLVLGELADRLAQELVLLREGVQGEGGVHARMVGRPRRRGTSSRCARGRPGARP